MSTSIVNEHGFREGFANSVLSGMLCKAIGLTETASLVTIHGEYDPHDDLIHHVDMTQFLKMMDKKYESAGEGYTPKFLAKARRNIFLPITEDSAVFIGQ